MKIYKEKLYFCFSKKKKTYVIVKVGDLLAAMLLGFYMKQSFRGIRISRANKCKTKYKHSLLPGDIITERTGLRFKVLQIIDKKL